ncbi:PorT family protein [Zhouia spongiae]|uniref:PorT family protein n=1 Tax=Zhouia spongiae TaxID=2202721 RepID=A0ABY3YMJ8_9FLAO|nr:porin family protein [Zhouia spongiae]UNY98845.1 PorT family protein [Zhouia spongiae]
MINMAIWPDILNVKKQRMIKMQKLLMIFFLVFIISDFYGQDKKANFGIKAGVNYGKYVPDKRSTEYRHVVGFYAGGFFNIALEEKLEFQPELLFALHGSRIFIGGLDIPSFDYNGNRLPNSNTYDFTYEVNELTISVPLAIKVFLSKNFYLESGPQFGIIVDRRLSSSQELLEGEDDSFVIRDGDSFDFGVCLGIGQKLSEKLSLNLRSYTGLIKRDDDIKSFVFNLGLAYNL